LDIRDIKHELLEKVKAASRVNLRRIKLLVRKKRKRPKRKSVALTEIIIIGASTGGPQTLEAILCSLPVNLPVPVIIVQHLPTRFFTESFAEHLNKVTDLEVKVAENAEVLQPGKVYLAPAELQMTFKMSDTDVITSLTEAQPDSLSPSVDIAMESAAKVYNGNSLGIILTGMGCDGREGMRAIKEAGGKTIVQDESSLIFGMPRAVIEAGIADEVLSVDGIADAMMECGGVYK
jgi:two-component system chemotaxis response regulator CheB